MVFTGDAEFKTPCPVGVFNLSGLLEQFANTQRKFSRKIEFNFPWVLETARLAVTRTTDVEHVERLQRRHGRSA